MIAAAKELLSSSTTKQPNDDDGDELLLLRKSSRSNTSTSEQKEASAFLEVLCAVGGHGHNRGSTTSDEGSEHSSSGCSSSSSSSGSFRDGGGNDDDDYGRPRTANFGIGKKKATIKNNDTQEQLAAFLNSTSEGTEYDDDNNMNNAALCLSVPMPPTDDGKIKVFTAPLLFGDDSGGGGLDGSSSSVATPKLSIRQGGRHGRRYSLGEGSVETVGSSDELMKIYDDNDDNDDDDEDEEEEDKGGESNVDKMLRHIIDTAGDENIGPIMGGSKDVRPNYASQCSVSSGSTHAIDNRTIQQALYNQVKDDDDDDDEENGDEDEDGNNSFASPKKYKILQGGLTSLKDNLKENLTEKAAPLLSKLKNKNPSSSSGDFKKVDNDDDVTEGDPPSAVRDNDTPQPQDPKEGNAGGDDDDNTYTIKDRPSTIASIPTNFNKRPRRRRGTVESESMWTALSGSIGSAFGYNRRSSDESQSSRSYSSSLGGGGSIEMHTGSNRINGGGSVASHNRNIYDGFSNEGDGATVNGGRRVSTESMPSIEEPNGTSTHVDDEESQTNGIDKIQGNVIQRRGSRGSHALLIDDDDDDSAAHPNPYGFLWGPANYRPGRRVLKRCIFVTLAVTIVLLSSALIGTFTVHRNEEDGTKHDLYVPMSHDGTLAEVIETIAEHGHYAEEDLFRMATSVDDHCHSEQLSTLHGRWECQQICHDHFCCFDVEQGVEEDSEGSYSCRTDESKLCRIFAGCEILVLEDFKGTGGKIENYQQQNLGATSYNGQEAEHGQDHSHQEASNEDDLGWQEIRRKYINVYCEASNVESKGGRKQCQMVCENHFCCFDTSRDGYNCQDDKSMTCDVYESCQVLMVGLFDVEGDLDVDAPLGLQGNELDNIPPDMIGDFLLPALPIENTGSEDFAPDPMGVLGDRAPGYIKSSVEYTAAELREMKADTKQRCSDYQSPTGRLQCEKICQNHQCCFASSDPATGEAGCRDDPVKLCDVYGACKVLSGSSNLSTWLANKKEEEKHPAKVVVVSPEIEKEMEGVEGEDTDYVDAVADTPEKYLETFDEEGDEYSTIVEEGELDIVEIDETSRPTPKRTPEPMIPRTTTPKPTQDATLPPASIPKTTATEQPVPVETLSPLSPPPTPPPIVAVPPPAMHISPATGKPPPPPPIRCIPEGDDEVHTEIYSDDWNDDRYDRCKRWEKKHSLTISEYWDMQGIDSTMEKNILENMLIMENGKNNAAAAAKEEEEAGEQDIISNDDLDDAILDEDQVLEDGEKDDEVRADSGMDGLATEYESLSDTEYENLSGPMLALDDLDDLIMFEDDAIGIEDDSIEDEDDMVFQVEEDFELGIGV